MDFLSDLWNTAKSAGPFANVFLLLVLYLLNEERKQLVRRSEEDRKAHIEMMQQYTERVLTAIHDATASIKDLSKLFYRPPTEKD